MARTGARPGDWTVTPLPGQVSALWVHRSATGVCFYRLRFAPADGGFVVTEALANRDPSQHTGTDDHDIGMLGFLLDSVLRDVPRRS